MTTQLLADLLDLPREVHQSGFVVSLTDSLNHAEGTLRDYVVTPQLAQAFESALRLVTSAVDDRTSKGAYLHSSFGGGKSHFLAVLGLALEGYAPARGKAGLAEVLARQEAALSGRRFLVVPLNLIGSDSMESAVLGAYVAKVRERHPDAPLPAVYVADGLLADAERLRVSMGDETFSGLLGSGASGGGWGKLAGSWDAESFDAAVSSPAGSAERERLVSALVSTMFTSVLGSARNVDELYVGFDEGLGAVSRHARDLGYDAVVYFLDELILWLASRMADPAFVTREGPKVGKLVESGVRERPAPIVSFVARQRDLRELVGEAVPGAEAFNFSEVLKWWEGRFETITLESRNLPAIVENRLLRPKTETAREVIDQAFKTVTAGAGDRVVDVLCTTDADRDTFRRISV